MRFWPTSRCTTSGRWTYLRTTTALPFLNFFARASQRGGQQTSASGPRAMRLRLFLGRIFRLEAEPKDALTASFGSRPKRQRIVLVSFVVSGIPEGLFRVVYRFENDTACLKYRIVPSMLRPSVPSLKRPIAIDSTLRSTCAIARGLRRSTWA